MPARDVLMKLAIIAFFSLTFMLPAGAEDSPYQMRLMKISDRFNRLEADRLDQRKEKKVLSEAEEKERHELLGQLQELDPVGNILRELEADLRALLASKPAKEKDEALVETLKTFMALTASMHSQSKDLEQAQTFAETIRGYIVRGDLKGMAQWVKSIP